MPIPFSSARGAGHPRPQLRRASWHSLDGVWDFCLDLEDTCRSPGDVSFDRTICVPFSPETPASGIGHPGYLSACWYRRRFAVPPLAAGARLFLRFGAADYCATVWVNDRYAGQHSGGYTPFCFDITNLLTPDADQVVVVRVEDDPLDLSKPRGKQDWQREPHSIWYPRTTGIWQTVWLEPVPPCHIADLRWTSNLERWEIGLSSRIANAAGHRLFLRVTLRAGGTTLADDTYSVESGEVIRRIALSDPGIDDSRNDLLWNPSSPTIIEADLELTSADGARVDAVESYTALRSVTTQGDRVLLNGRPFYMRLVLDQGYWPDTGLTAPDPEALRKDVLLAKAMGFNGVRKHQKIEDPRYLFWADHLGLLVWEEMPSAYRFTAESIERVTREWLDVVRRDASHPCIVAWVPFNESWGVPNLPDSPAERHYVRALYHLTRTLDPSRLVIGNDGWEAVATDVIGVHDYDPEPARLVRRYGGEELLSRLFRRERTAGRLIVLERDTEQAPIVLSEFGGAALASRGDTWGYATAETALHFEEGYAALLEAVRSIGVFAGFCYTQFSDTYQEANGLLYADRTPKFPIERIARATSGGPPRAEWLAAASEAVGDPSRDEP